MPQTGYVDHEGREYDTEEEFLQYKIEGISAYISYLWEISQDSNQVDINILIAVETAVTGGINTLEVAEYYIRVLNEVDQYSV